MRHRLPLILSSCALVVAVFGATPLGHAARNAVPFAKSAGYAKLAGNAQKLNGRRSTLSGASGTIPVVGPSGKLPASIGAVGPQGPKGDKGSKGDQGSPGLAAVEVVRTTATVPAGAFGGTTANCPSGKTVLGGGVNTANKGVLTTTSRPLSGQWEGRAFNETAAPQLIEIYAVCATAGQ
jgi:hypothetical protein